MPYPNEKPTEYVRYSPQKWLEVYGKDLQQAMAETGLDQNEFDMGILKNTRDKIVMKAEAAGGKRLIKIFNHSVDSGLHRSYREASILVELKDTGLVPAIKYIENGGKWIMMDWVDGETLQSCINNENVIELSFKVGSWIARYTDAMDAHNEVSNCNWADYYLQNYKIPPTMVSPKLFEPLRSLRISKRTISKEDPHLGNFVVDERGRIIGIDFELSTLKPYGWDILASAKALIDSFPHKRSDIIQSLLEGWGRGTDCISKDAFRGLVLAFLDITERMSINATQIQRRLHMEALREYTGGVAKSLVTTPAFIGNLVPLESGLVEQFCGSLKSYFNEDGSVKDKVHAQLPEADVRAEIDLEKPAPDLPELKVICSTCRGRCCKEGLTYHAFIDYDVIRQCQHAFDLDGMKEVIKHYLSFTPDKHFQGSCIFHGISGCTLPRKCRSPICNRYACADLEGQMRRLDTNVDMDGAVYCASDPDGVVIRVNLVHNGNVEPIDPDLLNNLGFVEIADVTV